MMSHVDEPDLYAILGVPADATEADISRAFRRRAFVAHPDHGGDAQAFRDLSQARETLLDPARRAGYDRRRAADRGPGPARSAQTTTGTAPTPEPAAEDPFEWASGAGPSTDDWPRWTAKASAWADSGLFSAYDPSHSWRRSDRFAWWKPPGRPESKRRRGSG
jgi:curved DNA-binding protein CbpA